MEKIYVQYIHTMNKENKLIVIKMAENEHRFKFHIWSVKSVICTWSNVQIVRSVIDFLNKYNKMNKSNSYEYIKYQ